MPDVHRRWSVRSARLPSRWRPACRWRRCFPRCRPPLSAFRQASDCTRRWITAGRCPSRRYGSWSPWCSEPWSWWPGSPPSRPASPPAARWPRSCNPNLPDPSKTWRAEDMGRILLVCRLAARDLRRGPVEAVLLLLAIAAASTTLTLGLVLHGVTSHPYEQTRAATNGPDVVAQLGMPTAGPHGPVSSASPGPQVLAQVKMLVHAPGVTGYSGPYPV